MIFSGLIVSLCQFSQAVPNYITYRKFSENTFKESKGNEPNFKQDTTNSNQDNEALTPRWFLYFLNDK